MLVIVILQIAQALFGDYGSDLFFLNSSGKTALKLAALRRHAGTLRRRETCLHLEEEERGETKSERALGKGRLLV